MHYTEQICLFPEIHSGIMGCIINIYICLYIFLIVCTCIAYNNTYTSILKGFYYLLGIMDIKQRKELRPYKDIYQN